MYNTPWVGPGLSVLANFSHANHIYSGGQFAMIHILIEAGEKECARNCFPATFSTLFQMIRLLCSIGFPPHSLSRFFYLYFSLSFRWRTKRKTNLKQKKRKTNHLMNANPAHNCFTHYFLSAQWNRTGNIMFCFAHSLLNGELLWPYQFKCKRKHKLKIQWSHDQSQNPISFLSIFCCFAHKYYCATVVAVAVVFASRKPPIRSVYLLCIYFEFDG